MRDAQLGMFDTTYVEWAERGRTTDFALWWAFESDDDPDIASVVAHLERRIAASEVLNRRLCHVPRHLDYPYWVFGVADIAGSITVDSRDQVTWQECSQTLIDMVAEPVDVTVVPWAFRIFRRVDGVVGTDRPCLVVSMTVSHSMFPGQATGPLGEYLWGPDGTDLTVPGLPTAARDYTTARALVRSLRALGQTAASVAHLVRSGLRGETAAAPVIEHPQWTGREFWSQGDRREVATVEVEVPKSSEFTVTQLWAASIPRVLARFHDDPDFGVMTLHLPVSVPHESLMGSNSLLIMAVPVTPERPTDEQLAGVREQMRTQGSAHIGEQGLAAAAVAKRVPRFAQRLAMNASGGRLEAGEAVLTSMRYAPKAQWRAAGSLLASAGFLPPDNVASLVHAVWTVGDSMKLSVAAWPQEPNAVARYAELLVEEFEALVVATPKAPA